MKQAGTVKQAPLILDEKSVYEIIIDGESYIAESMGRQALKDYLFVRRGQNIEIEGDVINNHIKVESARIDIVDIAGAQQDT